MACGNGSSAALAQILSNSLANCFERERPSLPILTLGSDITKVTAATNEGDFSEIFSKEIKTLANSNDILVICTSSGNSSNLLQAVKTAHEKTIPVIVLNGNEGGNLSSLLDIEDQEIRVPSNSCPRIHETHLLIIFCLCQLIENQLFGPSEL